MNNQDLKDLKTRLKSQKPSKFDKYKSQLKTCIYCGCQIMSNKCPNCGGFQKKHRSIFFLIVGLPLLVLGGYFAYYGAKHSIGFGFPLLVACVGLLSFGFYFTAPEN